MKTTVSISAEELEAILRSHLSEDFPNITKVKFETSIQETGGQRDPYKISAFEGVTCEVEIGHGRLVKLLDVGGRSL